MSIPQLTNKAIPFEVPTSLVAIAEEWEHFVSTGELNNKNIRPVIANSWKRCLELGINPLEERARSVITLEEIEAKLHQENLGFSGKNVLDKMSRIVEDTSHVIVLADKSGRILYSVGHQQIQDHLEKINFRPGGEWLENVVGPNGVGTPLNLGKPELVMGTEHFCIGWKPWVCYGAPIHNPSNHSVIGCIDITGPANNISKEAMALAISITQSIESHLSMIQLRNRDVLRQAYRDLRIKWSNDASLVVDEYGYIVDINSHACGLLNISPSELTGTLINLKYPNLWLNIQTSLRNGLGNEFDLRLQKSLIDHVHCLIKPIVSHGVRLGCVIHFTSGKNISRNKSTSLKYNQDDLIRKTLAQTGGNISKAAKILNINRATIYRRSKNW